MAVFLAEFPRLLFVLHVRAIPTYSSTYQFARRDSAVLLPSPALRYWVNALKELCDVKGGGVQGGGVMV